MFLHISRAREQGQICIYGFMDKICSGKKLLRFYYPTCTQKKPNYNRFCVPMHFAINRFTFEKFPPPPSLLHPNICVNHTFIQTCQQRYAIHSHMRDMFGWHRWRVSRLDVMCRCQHTLTYEWYPFIHDTYHPHKCIMSMCITHINVYHSYKCVSLKHVYHSYIQMCITRINVLCQYVALI